MAPRRVARAPLAAFAFLLLLSSPVTVVAQHVPQLESAITDQTGLLAGSERQIESALEDLFVRRGVQLYVLFVSTTGGMEIGEYASAVGEESLGPTDALLVVAATDRTDSISIGDGLRDRVSQTSLDRIRTQTLEPGLADGDFGDAVTDTAEALADVLPDIRPATPGRTAGGPPPAAPPAPVDPGLSAGPGLGSILLVVLGVVLVAGGVLLLIGRVRTLRSQRQQAFEEAKIQEELGREANKLLIATDDALRDAEQELGFVEAEFGAAQSGRLREALATAREALNAAFEIGQQLDDTIPEPPEKRRQMMQEIIERCRTAQATVDDQTAELARLRDMERNAPQVLARLEGQLSELEQRISGTSTVTTALSRFAASNGQSVAGNMEAARQKAAEARSAVSNGRAALEADKLSETAVAAIAAEDALEDAGALLDGMTNLVKTLDDTADKLKAELPAARTDVLAAREAVNTGTASTFVDTLREAEAALAEAEEAANARPMDVMNAFRRATEANALADRVLAGAREAEAQRLRAYQGAASAIAAAEASFTRVSDYISGYRRSQIIGRRARNRLAEAERHIDQARALLTTDTAAALEHAQAADALADEAYSLAQFDAPSYDPIDPESQRPDTDIGSLILGAILGGLTSGGNRSGGGWPTDSPTFPGRDNGGGGGGWSGRSSSGGFDLGSGGFGSGGFGGGGQSGGGFGGGRSSSGRW